MKINQIIYLGILLLVSLTSCDKGDQLLYDSNVHLLELKGYNNSSERLIIKLDTFKSVEVAPFSRIGYNAVYNFNSSSPKSIKLTMSSNLQNQTVLQKEIKGMDQEKESKFNLLYMDGKVSDFPNVPELMPNRVQLVYMFQSNFLKFNEPVDIVFGKYYLTPKVFEEFGRIKNLQPNTFSEPFSFDTFPLGIQEYNGQRTSVVLRAFIYKAGTDIPYTEGTNYIFSYLNSGIPVISPATANTKVFIINENPVGTMMKYNKVLEL